MAELTLAQIAHRYIDEFGLAIVPIPRGSKGPTGQGWNKPGGYFTDPDLASDYYAQNPRMSMGAVLGPSSIVSIDVDDVECTNLVFAEFGINIFDLKESCPTIIGNPARFRIWFKAPEGVDLKPHKLTWPVKNPIDNKKTFTVFELRTGNVQDVIPPSIHPDTQQPYRWHRKLTSGITELPETLLNYWLHWDIFKKEAESICPWAPKLNSDTTVKSKRHQENDDLIGRYNSENRIEDSLIQYGYKKIGNRYLSPNSSTGIPGIILFDDNRCWNHHSSDVLCSDDTGHPVSPFDFYCYHEHGNDAKKAVKQLAKLWGLKPPTPAPNQKPTNEPVQAIGETHAVDYFSPLPFSTDRGKPLVHIENLQEILRRLGVIVRYNVITKEDEILIPGKSFTMDNKSNATLAWLESECSRFNFSPAKISEFVVYLADQNLFNPVAQWVESKPWDGVSRLNDLIETITCKNESDNFLKEILMRRWLISAIAAAFCPVGVAAPGILVFQGDQYLGKTKWFKSLVPEEMDLVKDGFILDPSNKDSVEQACSFWMVELGELDATFKKSDIAALKAFITNKSDVFRKSYARKKSQFARRTVFFGSVNNKNYLNDPTGNRRFWTIEAAGINHSHGLNMQQIWAEVLTIYQSGESYFLTPEELDLLNLHNESFTAIDPIAERISSHLLWSDPPSLWQWKTATDILISIGIDKPNKSDATIAGMCLRKMNGGKSKRSNGSTFILAPNPR